MFTEFSDTFGLDSLQHQWGSKCSSQWKALQVGSQQQELNTEHLVGMEPPHFTKLKFMSEHSLIHRLYLTSGYTSDYIRRSGDACGTGINKYLVIFFPSTSRPVSNKVLLNTNTTNIQTSELRLYRNLHIVLSSHQNNLQNYVVKGSPDSHKYSLALNRAKQLYKLSYSASKFNSESKIGEADQNKIQVNSPSGMQQHQLKSVH